MLHNQDFILRARKRLSFFCHLYCRVSMLRIPLRSTTVHSDSVFRQRTTFHGANRELSDTHAKAICDPNFRNRLATSETAWHFLPPASHFGGLWEAGVKSVQHHLKRCIDLHTLTFEEICTLLCRIEVCLNSQLIALVSDNLDDYNTLSPGHFLIGTSLIASAEPSILTLKIDFRR